MFKHTHTGATTERKQESNENASHLLTPGQGMVNHDSSIFSCYPLLFSDKYVSGIYQAFSMLRV